MLSLLSLPNELIEQTARHLPFPDILKLSRVNHRLQEICNSHHLWEQIALDKLYNINAAINHSSRSGARQENNVLTLHVSWPDGHDTLRRPTIDEARRWAFAVEKLISAPKEQNDLSMKEMVHQIRFRECNDWLPHLLVSKLSAVLAIEPEQFFRSQKPVRFRGGQADSRVEAEIINANFILTFALLQRVQTEKDMKDMLLLLCRHYYPNWPFSYVQTQECLSIAKKLRVYIPDYDEIKIPYTPAQTMASLPAMIIELCSMRANGDAEVLELPKPWKMPFSDMMDVPCVLSNATEAFGTCHYGKMATAETFNGRRWVGYRAYEEPDDGNMEYNPNLQIIDIVARPPGDDEEDRATLKVIIEPETRGNDCHGDFKLKGTVHEGGFFRAKKTYDHGSVFQLMGRLTPFGIVGVWGTRKQVGGPFWIWDQEWS